MDGYVFTTLTLVALGLCSRLEDSLLQITEDTGEARLSRLGSRAQETGDFKLCGLAVFV